MVCQGGCGNSSEDSPEIEFINFDDPNNVERERDVLWFTSDIVITVKWTDKMDDPETDEKFIKRLFMKHSVDYSQYDHVLGGSSNYLIKGKNVRYLCFKKFKSEELKTRDIQYYHRLVSEIVKSEPLIDGIIEIFKDLIPRCPIIHNETGANYEFANYCPSLHKDCTHPYVFRDCNHLLNILERQRKLPPLRYTTDLKKSCFTCNNINLENRYCDGRYEHIKTPSHSICEIHTKRPYFRVTRKDIVIKKIRFKSSLYQELEKLGVTKDIINKIKIEDEYLYIDSSLFEKLPGQVQRIISDCYFT